MKNKKSGVAAIVFLMFMLLLTFFSKTIYRSLLPNVELTFPKGGNLVFQHTANSYNLSGDEAVRTYINYELPSTIYTDKVYVSENDSVDIGSPLITFYEPSVEHLLAQLREDKEKSYIEWRGWNERYDLALTAARSVVKSKLSQSEREKLDDELKLLERGIMDGTSKLVLDAEYERLCALTDYFIALKDDNWTLYSTIEGIVGDISVSSGDSYNGILPLIEIYPTDSAPDLLIEWRDFPPNYTEAWELSMTVTDRYGRIDCSLSSIERQTNGGAKIRIHPNNACDYATISQISIVLQSPYQPLLIPIHALDGNECYILAERSGAWGQTEYYAKRVTLTLADRDANYAIVRNGLSTNDSIIISSSDIIQDGQTVVIRE